SRRIQLDMLLRFARYRPLSIERLHDSEIDRRCLLVMQDKLDLFADGALVDLLGADVAPFGENVEAARQRQVDLLVLRGGRNRGRARVSQRSALVRLIEPDRSLWQRRAQAVFLFVE